LRPAIRAVLYVLVLQCGLCASAMAEDALISRMRTALSAVKDYRCDLRLDAKLPGLSIENMRMKLYYKRPNKVHVQAKEGFAMLPEEGLFLGDPMEEALKNFELTRMGDARYQGKPCIKYAARPRQDVQSPMGSLRLYVEKAQAIPVGITGTTRGGGEVSTVFEYRKVQGKYWLPVKTTLNLRNVEIPGSSRNGGPEKRSGNAVLVFSAYEVNVGLSDSLFKPQGKAPVNK